MLITLKTYILTSKNAKMQTCKLQDSKMQSIIDFKKLKFCCIILIFSAQFTCSGKIFFCTKLKILLNGKFQP